MSLHVMSFAVSIADTEEWPEGAQEAAEEDDSTESYPDWALARLRDAMASVGESFVLDNPTIYKEFS